MKILPLIAALLFTPVAFSQVSMGGNVIIGMPGPAGPAGTNGTNGAPGPNCSLSSPPGTCDLGTNTLLAGAVATTASVVGPIINGVYQVDGTTYASVQAAITACLASTDASCTIDAKASGRLGSPADVIGSYDPSLKAINLLLGPYSDYTQCTVTLRSGLHYYGTRGASSGNRGTVITSSCDAPMFTLPQDGTTVDGDNFQDFVMLPESAATSASIGFNVDCGTETTGGFQNFTFENVGIGPGFKGFPGGNIKMWCQASGTTAVIQFGHLIAVNSQMVFGGSPALSIAGDVGNIWIIGGRNDANNSSTGSGCDVAGSPNIYIGNNASGTQNPYSIRFLNTTAQNGVHAIQFAGAQDISLHSMHFEGCGGPSGTTTNGMLFSTGGSGNFRISIRDSYFASNIAAGASQCLFDTTAAGSVLKMDIGGNTWGVPANLVCSPASNNGQLITFGAPNFPNGASSGTAQVTANIVPTLAATTNVSGPLVVPGPLPFSMVNGGGNTTSIQSSALPEGGTFALRSVGTGWTLWAISQSESATTSTAYNCTTNANTQCTLTLHNNIPNPGSGGAVNVKGVGFAGSCASFTQASIAITSTTATTVVVPAPGGMGGTTGTCGTAGGTFSLISNLHLGGRSFLTPATSQTVLFAWNDATGFYDCMNCDVLGSKVGGPFSVSTSQQAGFQGDSTITGVSLTLPDGFSALCTQQSRWAGTYDGSTGLPNFSVVMMCEERPSNTAPSIWETDTAILDATLHYYVPVTAHVWTELLDFPWNAGAPFAELPAASTVGAKSVCLADGTNCPSAASVPRVVSSYCTGTATSSTTLSLIGLGAAATSCTGTAANGSAFMLPVSGTLGNLTVSCSATGVNASSGVFTIYTAADGAAPNSGSASAITVTYGTATVDTAVQDVTHTLAVPAKTKVQVRFTTQATETLGNCKVSFTY